MMTGVQGDYALAGQLYSDDELELGEIRARVLVEEKWPFVCAVADQLLAAEHLTQDDLETVAAQVREEFTRRTADSTRTMWTS